MLLFLIRILKEYWDIKIPSVFAYSSTRMILAAITALILTIFLGPFFIRKLYALKIGQSIRSKDECPFLAELHSKKKDTPTMGGILILFSMMVSLVLWMDFNVAFSIILLLATIWLGLIGGMDDFLKLKYKSSKGLSPRLKFIGQISFASLVALYLLIPAVSSSISSGSKLNPPNAKEFVSKKKAVNQTLTTKEYVSRLYIPFIKKPVAILDGAFTMVAFLFIVVVITGASNAVNLTDGLDGLASGCLVMSSLALALFAFFSNNIEMSRYLNILYIEGSGEVAIYLVAMAGACLGFLWYNGAPAQVFMGDTGSLALGGILGVSAVLLRREFLLAVIGGIFVAEAVSVILQVLSYRLRNKKRIFLCAPLHHHFEYKGWAETKVVLRFWLISLLLALVGIASLKFQ